MHDASLALQKAVIARLRAEVALVSARVFDRVEAGTTMPYIALGAAQVVDDEAGCIDGATCYLTLHIWSRGVGAVEARRVSDQAMAALTGWRPDLAADGFALVDLRCTGGQTLADPDGLTTHGILTIEAQTERLA